MPVVATGRGRSADSEPGGREPAQAGGPLNRDQGDCGTSNLLGGTAHLPVVKEIESESELRLAPQVLPSRGFMGATEEAETAHMWPGGK